LGKASERLDCILCFLKYVMMSFFVMGTTWRLWICVVVIFDKILRMLFGRRNNIDKPEFMLAIDEKENMTKEGKRLRVSGG